MLSALISKPTKLPSVIYFKIKWLTVPIPQPISKTLELAFNPAFFKFFKIVRCLILMPNCFCCSLVKAIVSGPRITPPLPPPTTCLVFLIPSSNALLNHYE